MGRSPDSLDLALSAHYRHHLETFPEKPDVYLQPATLRVWQPARDRARPPPRYVRLLHPVVLGGEARPGSPRSPGLASPRDHLAGQCQPPASPRDHLAGQCQPPASPRDHLAGQCQPPASPRDHLAGQCQPPASPRDHLAGQCQPPASPRDHLAGQCQPPASPRDHLAG
ncbi:D(4) dopamine receptor-like [Bacillus rossius redtenbacheri]|uniref:D(4) dopamine receptor-like n=1 Tax=Bacillus rossius redtenbacheri TaxID=93214 RepID=UPI002FDEA81B